MKMLKSNIGCLIETNDFPIDFLSSLAERESWRKEVYRPIYHIHKWWAKRLGSVFRGILLGCTLSPKDDLREIFYHSSNYSNFSIFDPFMGSGTTVGEAHKLGCIALGRDINPVACETVRVALGPLNRNRLLEAFSSLSDTVGGKIRAIYKSNDETGRQCDVLYFFWVKQVPCLYCSFLTDLFPSYVIARNSYPNCRPEVQVLCPKCGNIFPALHTADCVRCSCCENNFNPRQGTSNGKNASCPHCLRSFIISEAVRATGKPPSHRLYGKLLLIPDGAKRYLPTTPADIAAYQHCCRQLESEIKSGQTSLPDTLLMNGYNTRQAMGYNYRKWRDFFNDRQLLTLGWLHKSILHLSDTQSRDALLLLFSGVLEFNNLFASYKGEGTGAVRHMFAHHILRPERTPIEANLWGTSKSSGSFSNLFKSRLLRALDYRDQPFEVAQNGLGKAFYYNKPFSGHIEKWPSREKELKPGAIYLSCGSSDKTGLPDQSIDFVVTDPPFFDNVHYSELADFFYAWQRLHPRGFIKEGFTTRSPREVQDVDACAFSRKLRLVFSECHRLLKDQGLLIFTYHHSQTEGWTSLVEAVYGAKFSIINVHPIKSEMSVAAPKVQAKSPIQLDIIIVCKKQKCDKRPVLSPAKVLLSLNSMVRPKLESLLKVGLSLSKNDWRIILYSQFLASLGPVKEPTLVRTALTENVAYLDSLAEVDSQIATVMKQGKKRAESSQMELSLR